MPVCDPHWSPLYFVFGRQLCNLQRSNLEFASHFEQFHYFVDLFERFLTFIFKNPNDLYNFKDHFIHLVTLISWEMEGLFYLFLWKPYYSCSYLILELSHWSPHCWISGIKFYIGGRLLVDSQLLSSKIITQELY